VTIGDAHHGDSSTGLWPQLEDLVPPDLPPDIAVARLVALARSLLIENRQLREVLATTSGVGEQPLELADALTPHGSEAA
jgi:hypothetical protein